jgi:hypothetical protein
MQAWLSMPQALQACRQAKIQKTISLEVYRLTSLFSRIFRVNFGQARNGGRRAQMRNDEARRRTRLKDGKIEML